MAEPRIPIRTLEELNKLDDAEIIDGYQSGLRGDPEPGDNHSLSYWHGWRNGAADKGHIPHDDAMGQLAHEFVEDARKERQLKSEAK